MVLAACILPCSGAMREVPLMMDMLTDMCFLTRGGGMMSVVLSFIGGRFFFGGEPFGEVFFEPIGCAHQVWRKGVCLERKECVRRLLGALGGVRGCVCGVCSAQ